MNESGITFNMVTLTFNGSVATLDENNPTPRTERVGIHYVIATVAEQDDLPFLYDGDSVTVRELFPGDILFGTYVTMFDPKDDAEKRIYKLRDSFTKTLDGSTVTIPVYIELIEAPATDNSDFWGIFKAIFAMAEEYGEDFIAGVFVSLIKDMWESTMIGSAFLAELIVLFSPLEGYYFAGAVNNIEDLRIRIVNFEREQITRFEAYYYGRMLGDSLLMALGVIGAAGIWEIIKGIGELIGGGVISETGIGIAVAIKGAAEIIVGAVAVSGAVALVASAGIDFTENISNYAKHKGKIKLVDGMTVMPDQGLDLAIDFLGPEYNEIASGVFRSKDGLRQVRMTDSDLAPVNNHHGAAHMNFETGISVAKPNGGVTFVVDKNIHVFIT
ncbi:MAG: hypothetical protein LBH95_02070 [Oscillospiraceae bacterium]|jgi:hypothetical protein|nr:hypothetical protein [Oscillospiraceae bacterium]